MQRNAKKKHIKKNCEFPQDTDQCEIPTIICVTYNKSITNKIEQLRYIN